MEAAGSPVHLKVTSSSPPAVPAYLSNIQVGQMTDVCPALGKMGQTRQMSGQIRIKEVPASARSGKGVKSVKSFLAIPCCYSIVHHDELRFQSRPRQDCGIGSPSPLVRPDRTIAVCLMQVLLR